MSFTVKVALAHANSTDERAAAMHGFCNDFQELFPFLGRKHRLGVGDTLCAVLAVVAKAADITQNREPTAVVMAKWAEILRDSLVVIVVDEPAGHA